MRRRSHKRRQKGTDQHDASHLVALDVFWVKPSAACADVDRQAMTAQFRTTYQTNEYTQMAPEKVILALLDAALTATTKAMVALEDDQIGPRGEAVSRALAIVGELQNVLDVEAGEVAQNLFSLYDYAQRELLTGNMSGNLRHFQNAETVLSEIREGWAQMLQAQEASSEPGKSRPVREYV